MKKEYLFKEEKKIIRSNIYANKSALVLHSILEESHDSPLSIRGINKKTNLSLGIIKKVFDVLILDGILDVEGLRTNKKFFLKKPKLLLDKWLNYYHITEKCRISNYKTGISHRDELLEIIKKNPDFQKNTALTLHSAAKEFGIQNTNLKTVEFYLLDPKIKKNLEEDLFLEVQNNGYEVLIIEPYYKSLLEQKYVISENNLQLAPLLLTFLDLYNFPLRGLEQAEYMIEKIEFLKKIFKRV